MACKACGSCSHAVCQPALVLMCATGGLGAVGQPAPGMPSEAADNVEELMHALRRRDQQVVLQQQVAGLQDLLEKQRQQAAAEKQASGR
jgi:hypothetical protein